MDEAARAGPVFSASAGGLILRLALVLALTWPWPGLSLAWPGLSPIFGLATICAVSGCWMKIAPLALTLAWYLTTLSPDLTCYNGLRLPFGPGPEP
jgi:hypothetical protein